MAIQKHNAYYQSESGLYFYDEYGEKQEIEVNADSWKKYSDEHGSSGSKIYIGEGNSAYEGSVEIGSNNLGYHGGTILGDDNSAYNGSTIIGDRNWAVNGGGIFGEHNIGGKGGFVIGNDNKVKVWDNNTSSYEDVKQENVLDSSQSVYNYMLPNQVAIGYNNNVNHGRGPYIGTWTLTPFQIGSYNEVLDSLSGYSMPSTGIGAAIYNIGKSNSSVNAGVNIGGFNLILTGDGSVGASINIGKRLVNKYGILIGQDLSSNGYSFNIGEYSTTNAGGYNFGTHNTIGYGSFSFGNSNIADYGSFCIGRSITSNNGSFAFGGNQYANGNSIAIGIKGDYNFADGASMVIGFNNSAKSQSTLIGIANTAYGRSFIFGAENKSIAQAVIVGMGNKDNISNENSQGEWINFFGRYNSVDGADDITNKNYQYNIIGDCNKLNLSGSQNAFGLIVGYNNRVNNHNANNIGGYNIIIGKENSGNCESINIGSNNETVGHSIGLGWRNIANTNSYAHSILLGKDNYSDTNRPELIPATAQSGKYVRRVENGNVVYKLENPETNNFVVGTNNSASHYNSIIIGSVNQTLSAVPNPEAEEGEEFNDDDGFTVAIGLGNIAARNYDMAIGYSTLASGGENIAIGAPQLDSDYDELLWNTNAVGYRNIAIRSNVSGIGNIAFESNFEGNGINNVILNSQISGTTDGDSDYPYARNDIRYSNGILNVGNDCTDNVIKTTTANIDCKRYCVNNTIQNSNIDITVNEVMVNNFINTITATGETDTFRHNVIFFSDIDVTSGDYNFTYSDNIQNHSNFLVGVSARNVNGTFGFADKNWNSLQEVIRSYSFGDNHLNRVRESTVFGQSNYLSSTDKSFVVGNGNSIYVPCSGSNNEPASMELIIGFDNIMNYSTITSTNDRNKIIGNGNNIYAETDVTDNVFIGNGNRLIYFTNVPDNHVSFPDIPYYDDIHDTYALYRNVVLGSNNAISQCISNGFIAGDYNTIMTTNTGYEKDDSLYDSSIILGFGNVAYNGSKQLAIGEHNNVSGHFAYALGEDLSAQDFQMVVGKYNAPVPKSTRTTSAWVNNTVVEIENSGVVFAIGNGRLNCYEKDGEWYDGQDEWAITNPYDESLITRSNAMIVSANGTVSAGDFEISGCKLSDIIDVVTLLKNKPASGQPYMIGLDNNGNLTWMNV